MEPTRVNSIVRLIGFLVQRRVFEIESARSLRERPDNPDADGHPDSRLFAVQHAAKPAEAWSNCWRSTSVLSRSTRLPPRLSAVWPRRCWTACPQ